MKGYTIEIQEKGLWLAPELPIYIHARVAIMFGAKYVRAQTKATGFRVVNRATNDIEYEEITRVA